MKSGQELIPKLTQTRKGIRQVVLSDWQGRRPGNEPCLGQAWASRNFTLIKTWIMAITIQTGEESFKFSFENNRQIFLSKRKQFIHDRTSTPPEIALLVCVADVAQPQV